MINFIAYICGHGQLWPCEFCMQSRKLSVVGWSIFLWMVLGLMLNRALHFVMATLQLIVVCLAVILYVAALAYWPMYWFILVCVCVCLLVCIIVFIDHCVCAFGCCGC